MCGLSTREYRGRNHIDVKKFAMPDSVVHFEITGADPDTLRRYDAGPV